MQGCPVETLDEPPSLMQFTALVQLLYASDIDAAHAQAVIVELAA